MSTATPIGPAPRERDTLGGIVPVGAVARAGVTAVCCPALEIHNDGTLMPLIILTDNAGPVGLDVGSGVRVRDDLGTRYSCREAATTVGLGLLHSDVWIEPCPPPEATRLEVSVNGLVRTAITRRGDSVARLLSDGPWEFSVALRPERTQVPVPAEPPPAARPPRPARVPVRSLPSFDGVVPIGQAAVEEDRILCLWGLERYGDRGVLTLVSLSARDAREGGAGPGEAGAVRMWDDRGRRYDVVPVHVTVRAGWTQVTLETTPALGSDVGALGIAVEGPAAENDAPLRTRSFGVRVSQ